MCGIVGVLEFEGRPLDRQVVERMTETLAHRGPEAWGSEILDAGPVRVGLGHTRLKIIDLSDAASQPMTNEDRSVWIVFNGEIYNFRELRASLVRRGVQFRTSSDTEVILRLYEAEGEQCVDALDGMFAFALWDTRRRIMLLARDRVGKKPLFYYSTPSLFAFASEVKALLRHPEIVVELNVEVLPEFFLYGYVPTPKTFYRGIRTLPPGHVLQVDQDGKTRTTEYWDLPVVSTMLGPPPTDAEATHMVRELVTEAVRRRLIADVPLGAFLSGGIDSTVVVGLMSRLMAEPVRTFSIGFARNPDYDERQYARLASERLRTAHTEFVVEPSAVDLVERLVWHHDGPFGDSSAIPTYLVSQLAREHVTVALNGDGGDELFAGYRRFPVTVVSERVPAWMRLWGGRLLSGLPEWGSYRSPLRRLKNFSAGAALPLTERYSRLVAIFYQDLPALLADWEDKSRWTESLDLGESLARRHKEASPLTRLLYLNFKTYLLDDLLVKMDRCSMAHALEARSPLLDRSLLEYTFALPDATKLRLGQTKVIFRRAFADLVPPEILWRRKMGFAVPLAVWFTEDLRDFLRDLLLARDARLREYVDQGYVNRLCQAHMSGRADYSARLWTLLTFETWLRSLPHWAGSRVAKADRAAAGSKRDGRPKDLTK
jgi:asparagine synthase (glutamine-hydrolysing)